MHVRVGRFGFIGKKRKNFSHGAHRGTEKKEFLALSSRRHGEERIFRTKLTKAQRRIGISVGEKKKEFLARSTQRHGEERIFRTKITKAQRRKMIMIGFLWGICGFSG